MMGIVSRILKPPSERALSKEQEMIFERSLGWASSTAASGVDISEEKAMSMSAVYACVRVLAETVASLPLPIYRRIDGGGKERAPEHPLYSLLHDAPNDYQTSMIFRETLMAHLCLWGNAYSEIVSVNNKIQALIPILPSRVKLSKDGLWYHIKKPDSDEVKLPWYQILHIPALGYDGRIGKSPITMAREAIGLGLASETYGSKFFANNAKPGMALVHPGSLTPEGAGRLKATWNESQSGLTNAHRVALLEEGMKIETFGVPPEEAQFLETRKFQVEEIARIFRVPLHLIQAMEKSTSWGSGIEQLMIGFVVHTIRPWLVRWEQAINARLISDFDRSVYFAEFLIDGLMRGDAAARGAFYRELFYIGSLNQNEIREMENKNPIPEGDTYYVPINLMPVGSPRSEPIPISEPASVSYLRAKGGLSRRRVRDSYKPLFRDAMVRTLRGERRNVKEALKKKSPRSFENWLNDYYREEHLDFIIKNMKGLFFSLAEAVAPLAAGEVGHDSGLTPAIQECVRIHVEKFAYRQSMQSLNRLLEIVGGEKRIDPKKKPEDDFASDIDEQFDEWEESRSDSAANWETVRTESMVTKAIFVAAGVMTLRWVANANCCPFCEELDEAIVGVEHSFVSTDGGVEVEGEDDLTPSWNVVTPPLHDHCDCSVELDI